MMLKHDGSRMRTILIVFFSIILMTVSPAFVLGDEGIGKIIVNVHGYDGSSPLKTSLLDAHRYIENKTLSSDRFSFENVTIGQEYFVSIVYKGVSYVKNVVMNSTVTEVNFTVFNVTKDDADIIIPIHKMLFVFQDNVINVMEVVFYENKGDKVFNGTIDAPLPIGYSELQTSIMECCVRQERDRFTIIDLMEPLKPNGTYPVQYSYKLSPKESEYTYAQMFPYPTSSLIVLVEKGQIRLVNFNNLEGGETFDAEGKQYELLSASNLTKDKAISLTFEGFPQGITGMTAVWVGMGLMSSLIILVGLWSFMRKGESLDDLRAKKGALFATLERLEKDLAERRIEKHEYEKLWNKYKQEAVKTLKKMEKFKKVRSKDQ